MFSLQCSYVVCCICFPFPDLPLMWKPRMWCVSMLPTSITLPFDCSWTSMSLRCHRCVRVCVHDCVHGCMRVFEYEKLYSEGTYVCTCAQCVFNCSCTAVASVHSVCSTVVVQQWLVCTVIKLQQISRNPCT